MGTKYAGLERIRSCLELAIILILGVVAVTDISQNKIKLDKVIQEHNYNDNQLQEVLDSCERQNQGEVVHHFLKVFFNATHHIDNLTCEWIKIGGECNYDSHYDDRCKILHLHDPLYSQPFVYDRED